MARMIQETIIIQISKMVGDRDDEVEILKDTDIPQIEEVVTALAGGDHIMIEMTFDKDDGAD